MTDFEPERRQSEIAFLALAGCVALVACSRDRDSASNGSERPSVDATTYRAVACTASEVPHHVGVWASGSPPLLTIDGHPTDTVLLRPEACDGSGPAGDVEVCDFRFIRPPAATEAFGERARGGAVDVSVADAGSC